MVDNKKVNVDLNPTITRQYGQVENKEILDMVTKATRQLTRGWGYEGEKITITEYSYSFTARVEIMPSKLWLLENRIEEIKKDIFEDKLKRWTSHYFNRRIIYEFEFDKREIFDCYCKNHDFQLLFEDKANFENIINGHDIFKCKCDRSFFVREDGFGISEIIQYKGWGSFALAVPQKPFKNRDEETRMWRRLTAESPEYYFDELTDEAKFKYIEKLHKLYLENPQVDYDGTWEHYARTNGIMPDDDLSED